MKVLTLDIQSNYYTSKIKISGFKVSIINNFARNNKIYTYN